MKIKISILLVSIFLLAACGPKVGPTPAGTLPPIPTNTTGPSGSATNTPVSALPTDTVAGQASATVDVKISGFAFDPAELTVKMGTTVRWTNLDSATHNVVALDNSWGSNDLGNGDAFSFTFTKAGTYEYRCGFHANMKGTITVTP